jgi:hypothetical protein
VHLVARHDVASIVTVGPQGDPLDLALRHALKKVLARR